MEDYDEVIMDRYIVGQKANMVSRELGRQMEDNFEKKR